MGGAGLLTPVVGPHLSLWVDAQIGSGIDQRGVARDRHACDTEVRPWNASESQRHCRVDLAKGVLPGNRGARDEALALVLTKITRPERHLSPRQD